MHASTPEPDHTKFNGAFDEVFREELERLRRELDVRVTDVAAG